MEISCVVIELKSKNLKRVREWASFIQTNEEDALETLNNEGVTVENFFLVTLDKKDYLIG